jgi:putative transposase
MNAIFNATGISKQAFHQWRSRWQIQMGMEEQILYLIRQIRWDHPGMGVRDIYHKLNPLPIGRDKFEDLCRSHRLLIEITRNPCRTTDSRGVKRFPNLLKELAIERPNQVWQSDITYFEVAGKFCYLTFIQDTYTKLILGWAASNNLTTEDTTIPALAMAIGWNRTMDLKGLILHSDGGGQYYDALFLQMTASAQIKNSMCEEAWENGMAERLNGVIKRNYLRHKSITSFEQLCKEVDRTVYLYNFEKPHKKLQRMTPVQFVNKTLPSMQQLPLRMRKSFDAKLKGQGHRAPDPLKQPPLRTQNVISAKSES